MATARSEIETPRKIDWEYCENCCKGFNARIGKHYFWMFDELGGGYKEGKPIKHGHYRLARTHAPLPTGGLEGTYPTLEDLNAAVWAIVEQETKREIERSHDKTCIVHCHLNVNEMNTSLRCALEPGHSGDYKHVTLNHGIPILISWPD